MTSGGAEGARSGALRVTSMIRRNAPWFPGLPTLGLSPREREAEKRAGYRAVDERSRGWCEAPGCDRRAASHHHMAGRVGPGVNDPDLIVHLCLECDLRVTTEPAWAKAEGLSVDRVPRRLSKAVES